MNSLYVLLKVSLCAACKEYVLFLVCGRPLLLSTAHYALLCLDSGTSFERHAFQPSIPLDSCMHPWHFICCYMAQLVQIADTVIVVDGERPKEVATSSAPKNYEKVTYTIQVTRFDCPYLLLCEVLT